MNVLDVVSKTNIAFVFASNDIDILTAAYTPWNSGCQRGILETSPWYVWWRQGSHPTEIQSRGGGVAKVAMAQSLAYIAPGGKTGVLP
jgi:hypothetical protein